MEEVKITEAKEYQDTESEREYNNYHVSLFNSNYNQERVNKPENIPFIAMN